MVKDCWGGLMEELNGLGEKEIKFIREIDFKKKSEWFMEKRDLLEKNMKEKIGDIVEKIKDNFEKERIKLKGEWVK